MRSTGVGAQLPRVRVEPERAYTDGDAAAELSAAYGNTLDPWQKLILDCWLGRDEDGNLTAITCVIYDEVQELTDEHVEAIMSTLAASPTGDRQIIYDGTPPFPKVPGDVFKRIRRAAIKHPSQKMAWHEWGVDSAACPVAADMTYDDVRDMVFDTNSAMGVRLDDEFTEEEFNTMSPDGFARERLGWWDSRAVHYDVAIDGAKWDACAVGEPPTQPPLSSSITALSCSEDSIKLKNYC